jgi:hypothetical protein
MPLLARPRSGHLTEVPLAPPAPWSRRCRNHVLGISGAEPPSQASLRRVHRPWGRNRGVFGWHGVNRVRALNFALRFDVYGVAVT